MHADGLAGRAVLALALASATGCSAIYGPTTPDRNWVVHDTPRFSLYARPGSFAEGAAAAMGDVLEDQYTHTVRVLELQAAGRISVFLYNDRSEVRPELPSERSGVAFPETNAVHIVCVPPLDEALKSLLAHEANHVIVQNGLGRAGTSMMNEGLASALISERHGPIGPTYLYTWTRRNRGQLLPIAQLADDGKWSSSSMSAYRTCASFLAYLLERYGPAPLRQLYYANSSDFAARVAQIYGKPLEQLEADWLAFVGS